MKNMKLILKMVAADYSRKKLSKVIGISKNTLASRINGKTPFNTDEITKISAALDIATAEEIAEIFLRKQSQ